jgi:hypothetical protein
VDPDDRPCLSSERCGGRSSRRDSPRSDRGEPLPSSSELFIVGHC